MGYAPQYFTSHVLHWINSGWLPRGGAVADLGAQELNGDPVETMNGLRSFLAQLGAESEDFLKSVTLPDGVGQTYRQAGFRYISFDIDGRFGSTYLDLNIARATDALRGQFDVVNNEGTIEHLANPINGFIVAHDLCKVGGVIRHSMPVSGWHHHGLFHPTPWFYHLLTKANGYEILEGIIEINRFHRVAAALAMTATAIRHRSLRMLPGEFWGLDKWVHFTYKKTRDAAFVIPVDHLEGDDGKIANRVREDFHPHDQSSLPR